MDAGKSLGKISIDLKLSVLKPLHASWLIEPFNHMTSAAGRAVSLKSWEVAGITEGVRNGISGLPSLESFHDIDPLSFTPVATEENDLETVNRDQREMYVNEESMVVDDSHEEEWVDGDGNAFYLIVIDEEEDD